MNYDDIEFSLIFEFTGIPQLQAAKLLAYYLTDEEYNETNDDMREYIVLDLIGRVWRIEESFNIECERKVTNGTEIETTNYDVKLMTPSLNYIEMGTLQEILQTFWEAGGIVNETCKMSISVDVKELEMKHLRNLCNIVYVRQDLMYKALSVNANGLRHAKKFDDSFIEKLKRERPQSIKDFREIWYEELGGESRSRSYFLDFNNLFIYKDKTIRIRLLNSTFDVEEVKAYIDLYLSLVSYSYKVKSTVCVSKKIIGSEKYAFRVFLMQLGLIGKEFNITRYHLMKNLRGSTSHKDIT